jgi:hypothetical protein
VSAWGVRTINEHIQNIFEERELSPDSVIRKFRIAAADGKSYETQHYNLDVVIAVGYRVKSHRGTQFRQWARMKAEREFETFDRERRRLEDAPADARFADEVESLTQKAKHLKAPKRKK